MYSPRAGADSPLGPKFWWQQKGLFSLPICCKFQNDLFKIWFYTHFLMILYMYIASGARAENPLGTNFWCQQKALITLTICCKFQTNLLEFWFYKHFLMFFHMYIAQGQSSGEDDFWKVFTIYGRGGHLRHVTQMPGTTFTPPIHGGSTWNLALIGPAVLEKIFENDGRTDNGRRSMPIL